MTLVANAAPMDELHVVEVDADASLTDAADGTLAARLAAAFAAAREAAPRLRGGGCLVFCYRGGPALRGGIASLTRTLALEWAPDRIRVNAVAGRAEDSGDLLRLLASPASRMLTGAVIDAP